MENNIVNTVWDPLGEPIVPATFAAEDAAISQKVQYYQQHPGRIKRVSLLLSIPLMLVAVIIAFLLPGYLLSSKIILFVALSSMPLIIYCTSIEQLQAKALTLLLCQSQKWIFDPSEDDQRLEKLAAIFPQIFKLGKDQQLSAQVWGKIAVADKSSFFWSAVFEYTTGSGKSSHTYTCSVVALPLHTAIPVPFQIHPHAVFFDAQHMKTESAEFNKLFAITADKSDEQTKAAVLGVLTPSLQVRLCDFYQKYGPEMILFQDKTILFLFAEPLWSVHYTNFFKQVAVDPRDEQAAVAYIVGLVAVMDEMIQYTSE